MLERKEKVTQFYYIIVLYIIVVDCLNTSGSMFKKENKIAKFL